MKIKGLPINSVQTIRFNPFQNNNSDNTAVSRLSNENNAIVFPNWKSVPNDLLIVHRKGKSYVKKIDGIMIQVFSLSTLRKKCQTAFGINKITCVISYLVIDQNGKITNNHIEMKRNYAGDTKYEASDPDQFISSLNDFIKKTGTGSTVGLSDQLDINDINETGMIGKNKRIKLSGTPLTGRESVNTKTADDNENNNNLLYTCGNPFLIFNNYQPDEIFFNPETELNENKFENNNNC